MILTHGANSLSRGSGGQTVNIGGRYYRIVEMPDGKVWLAENLDFAWNGLSVPTGGAGTSTTPQAMYYLYDESTYGWDGYKCGLLYNWYAVKYLEDNKSILIPGWHVPSHDEWGALAEAIGGTSTAGRKLKALDNSAGSNWPSSWDGTDEYEFSVLPAGYYNNSFLGINSYEYYWTATEYNSSNAITRIFTTSAGMSSNDWSKKNQYSIRLVKDVTQNNAGDYNGTFNNFRNYGNFWTKTESDATNAYDVVLNHYYLSIPTKSKLNGYSVRLVKDAT